MIVKDESEHIEECLASIAHLVDTYVICDTGSTDDTGEKIKAFFDARGVAGEIIEHEFRTCTCHMEPMYKKYHHFHFGWNRSYALEKCVGKSDFILIMDADDVLSGTFQIPNVLFADQYYVRMQTDFNFYFRPLLIRNDPRLGWKFKDGLHEYLHSEYSDIKTIRILGDYAFVSRRLGARNKDPLKYQKDVQFLEELIRDEPSNTRYKHFHAQSLYDAGKYDEAIAAYSAYIPLEVFDEAAYVARLMIGRCHKRKTNSETAMVAAFEECFKHHPQYAEPMYELCKYFNDYNDFKRAYGYGIQAIDIPCPFSAILYLWQDVYDYKFEDEMIWCASQLGKYKEALGWSLRMLKRGKYPQESKALIEENIRNLWSFVNAENQMPRLGIYIGPSPVPVGDEECFGSELAVKYLAKELAGRCNVIIIADGVKEGLHVDLDTGITYMSTTWLRAQEGKMPFEVMIVSRYVNYFMQFDAKTIAKRTYIWIHDVVIHPYFQGTLLPDSSKALVKNIDACVDGYVCLSRWHRQHVLDIYGLSQQKVHIIGHGIDVGPKISDTTTAKRVKNRFIWISDHQRGLETCIRMFLIIKNYLLDAELHVYRNVPEQIKTSYASISFIKFMGFKKNEEILESLMSADYLLYPTSFTETFCISALEAQRMGCICITSHVAALTETVGDRGILVLEDPMSLVDKLLELDRQPELKEQLRSMAVAWAKTQTWRSKSREWANLIGVDTTNY